MKAQGSGPFNKAYFSQLTIRINLVNNCDELQAAVDEAFASINAQLDGITAQMEAIKPLLALISPPTSLGAIIGWIGNFINAVIKPMVKPYTTYALQLAELTAAIVELQEAIRAASVRITVCSIKVPSVRIPPPPVLDVEVLT